MRYCYVIHQSKKLQLFGPYGSYFGMLNFFSSRELITPIPTSINLKYRYCPTESNMQMESILLTPALTSTLKKFSR